mgnify:CR=1 FL=1
MSNKKSNRSVKNSIDTNKTAQVVNERPNDPINLSDPMIGVVNVCSNIRETPVMKDNVIGILRSGEKVIVDLNKSTDKWFRVHTESGLEGFCVKALITVQQ